METTQQTSDSSFEVPSSKNDWPAKSHIDSGQWTKIQQKYGLSRREIDVCKAMCRGCSNKQIAAILGISASTIEGHQNKIYLKVGVHTRIRLLLTFLEI